VPTFTLSRGVIYSVEAQDLLMGLGALDHDEEARLTRFHEVMADLIRPLTNDEFAAVRRGKYRDEAYNNQFIADLTSELALWRACSTTSSTSSPRSMAARVRRA
jgi:monoamine oxidase